MAHSLVTYLDHSWQRAVENVRTAAARLWERPARRHAVDHGPAHAERVAVLLSGLTEGLMKRGDHPLASEEIYILLAATYLHAIGLQDEQTEPDPAARWIRYPELGAEMVYHALEVPEKTAELGLVDDPGLVEMVARIIARHRETDYPSPDYDDFPLGGIIVRPRLLAALLHLTDGLDLDYRRVDLAQLKLMAVSPDEVLDWWLHHYVSGVQVIDEFVKIGYRVPRSTGGRAPWDVVGAFLRAGSAYEKLLPELVESKLRADLSALRNIFRLHGVKVDIGASEVQPMRAVKPLPAQVWAAAESRLADLRGVKPSHPPLSPLVETVRGLLTTMGYDCAPPHLVDGPLICFRCRPRGGGLRSPIMIGCKVGPAEVADVQTVIAQLDTTYQQGYVVAEARILPSALAAAGAGGWVRVFTLAGFYRELLDFRGYVEQLVDDYQTSELASYYVDLGCLRVSYDKQGQPIQDSFKPIDSYVDVWLKPGAERNHISILGDYGTGKTSFCRQYAAKQGRRWLASPDEERIPLLVNLRDYTKTLEVGNLITGALVNQYGIQGATFEAFMRYNADGKLLIFFDGFDEMAQRTGLRTAVDNFWEMAKIVVPGSKVILTCRTPYFRTRHEAEALLHGERSPLSSPHFAGEIEERYIDLRDRPNFEIVHLEPFSDDDIQAVLRARLPKQWKGHWTQIQHIYNLPDLARRPVLLDMIARTLPDLKAGQAINAARLYQVYTDMWLGRDVLNERVLLSPADRRLFAEELAMQMLHSGEWTLHYSRIPERVKAHFRLEKAEEIDYFEADIRTCNFLNRDEAGHYAFAHKSFMEFFAACRLHSLMLEDKATADGPVAITEEVRQFLNGLFALTPKPEPGPPCPPPKGFVWVPPGEFIMGGESGLDVRITRLERGIFVAQTPVTNAQYARFMQEGGYEKRDYWTEDGWKWKEQGKLIQSEYWTNKPFNRPSQPVVGVSWYEASAYGNWLATRLGRPCRLLTEQEWEKAARGYDGREYPWGEWAEGRCNTAEAGIRRTSPAGRFSSAAYAELSGQASAQRPAEGGDSPYGLQDAAGNVWSWTSSGWEPGSSLRVVRGGSWFNSRDSAHCAYRFRGHPDVRSRALGFRVCVMPQKD
jgi:formylglycine-generating enzyme required for sulfatase activity